MMEIEDDTYTSIFQALKHPIRRRILRMLKEHPYTYTEILSELGIDNGLLNYHLENFKDLLTKGDDERYRLSKFGEAGLSVIDRVETPKEKTVKTTLLDTSNLQSIVIILLLTVSTLLNGYYVIQTSDLRGELETMKSSYMELQSNYTRAQEMYQQQYWMRQLGNKTAWLMVSGFRPVPKPDSILNVTKVDLFEYPKIKEAFDVLAKYSTNPHPYEWVNCTSMEGVEIVGLLGGDIIASPIPYYGGNYFSWSRDVYCDGKYYNFYMAFSDVAPVID
jgi:DNA-binding transcriptional ArsR family regulator